MNNCDELRVELSAVWAKFKAGELSAHEAQEYANLAGKMISSAKVQVAYYSLLSEFSVASAPPSIPFLESPHA